MSDQYEIEALLRPPVELASSIVAFSLAWVTWQAPQRFFMTPDVASISAVLLSVMGLWRLRQGWHICRYQRHIHSAPRYAIASKQIPTSRSVLFLGKGFRWTQLHTERLYAARDRRAAPYLSKGGLTQWVRRQEVAWEHTPLLKTFMQWTATDSILNPLRPAPPTGGDPVIHGVGIGMETHAVMPLSDRAGHLMVVARTRHGKTRLAEMLTTQDIRRGNNCVIVLDPKGDADYLKRVYIETKKAKRPLIIFHLGYPEISARYNALASYSRITEVASRTTSPLPDEGDAGAFKEFAWLFVNVIAVALDALGEKPNFVSIKRYINDIDPLIIQYGHYLLNEKSEVDWEAELLSLQESLKPKMLSRAEQGKALEAVVLVRYIKAQDLVDPVFEGLQSVFRYDNDYFQKLTVAIKPFLEKLTTGKVADIIAPKADSDAPVLAWREAIQSQSVVYVGLDALTDPEVASAIGESMFSDLTSLAGHIYKHGIYPDAARRSPKIIIHGDEFSDLLGPKFKTLINKSGGAGYELNLYTQTWSDVVAELGSEAKAGQLAGSIGTVIIMGVKEIATCEMFTQQLPDVSVSEMMAVSGFTDSADANTSVSFVANNQDRISITRVPMISPADIVALPKGQAFVLLKGSELWKIRMPLPLKTDDDELPDDLGEMLEYMRCHYMPWNWQSYHEG